MNSEKYTAKAYQVVFVLPTDTKSKLPLFTDKQTFQEVKTTGGLATQLKRADGFTLRTLYSS
jgi:hypothetical protein